jgi:hypothetical protein
VIRRTPSTTNYATHRERRSDGTHIAAPIAGHDLAEVREWCSENCEGDFMIVLGQRVVFARREDAALALVTFC